MSQFPVHYPQQEGKGRLLVISAFKDDDQKNEFQSYFAKQLPSSSALNLLQGSDIKNGSKLLFADFAPSTRVPAVPGALYSSKLQCSTNVSEIVPHGEKSVSYTFNTTEGAQSTPRSGYYLLNLMRCPKENQPTLAAAMDAYLRGIYYCGTFKLIF